MTKVLLFMQSGSIKLKATTPSTIYMVNTILAILLYCPRSRFLRICITDERQRK